MLHAQARTTEISSLNDDLCWQRFIERTTAYDGAFIVAVATTRIYCRPSCPARRPRRENVRFYLSAGAAREAGFRACKRCHPDEATPAPDIALAQRVCAAIEAEEDDPDGDTSLAALGASLGVSPFHLQRTFKRVTGITPRQYADVMRVRRFKKGLREGDAVTDAIYDAGYGSASSVYERVSDGLGMTPGAYKRGGAGATVRYATADAAPLGRLLVAATERGVCAVTLGDADIALVEGLAREFPAATRERDDAGIGTHIAAVLAHLSGAQPRLDLPLDVQATAFQRRVWEALRAIPTGETRSYREVAASIGQPTAARAVARACATNPVALTIPCHRVVREGGDLGGYRWGVERKRALLDRERAAYDEGEGQVMLLATD